MEILLLGLFLSLLAAFIPVIIYGWFINWLDQYEKEPFWLLLLVFLWGAVPAVIMSLIAQILLDIPTTWVLADETLVHEVVGGSVWAPLTEEIFKGTGVVIVFFLAYHEFDNVLDGIIYGAMAGLGFAFTENILYFLGALTTEGWGLWVGVVLLRTVLFGLNHAFFTGVIGAGFGVARLTANPVLKIVAPVGGFVGAMTFHGLHNLGSTLAAENGLTLCGSILADWGGILLLGVIVGLIWRQEKSWMAAQLSSEISPTAYQIITSWRRWSSQRWGALLRGDLAGWRKLGEMRQAAAELAFKKHQATLAAPPPNTQAEIERYRAQLAKLGAAPPPPGQS
jgi:RsiW-degrading membrane proteinase PrsW (M82 family)